MHLSRSHGFTWRSRPFQEIRPALALNGTLFCRFLILIYKRLQLYNVLYFDLYLYIQTINILHTYDQNKDVAEWYLFRREIVQCPAAPIADAGLLNPKSQGSLMWFI